VLFYYYILAQILIKKEPQKPTATANGRRSNEKKNTGMSHALLCADLRKQHGSKNSFSL
jgi:hypothetical protein